MLRTAEELDIRALPFEKFTPDYIMDLYNYVIHEPYA